MRKSLFRYLPIAATLLSLSSFAADSDIGQAPNILMVLSSYGEKDAEGNLVKPGYEFDELTKSYLVFKSSGAKVTFASPKGGEIVADNYDANKSYNQQFLADKNAVESLASTNKLSGLKAKNFDAIYVVGGKGPMFDLPNDEDVKRLISKVYEANGVVAAVCHGPAALLNVKLSDDSYLIEGKRISGFTNLEESAFTKKWQLPFSLADRIKERGAKYRQDGLMLNQVSVDSRIITGQNPFSTADTAKAVVKALGLDVADDIDFKDDRTIKLVEAFFADKDKATELFLNNQSSYDPMLLGMFGVFQAKHANTEAELNVAIVLMELTHEIINHPMLDLAIANAYLDKNNAPRAIETLHASQKKFPENQKVKDLLSKIAVL